LLVTNGFPRDVTDRDFANFKAGNARIATVAYMLDSIPVAKVPNYAFKNKGDLTFENVTRTWGLDIPSFSNGAAFVDLDNDGDLDYVVNNINDDAFLYENTLISKDNKDNTKANFLRIKLAGKTGNTAGLGTKITLRYSGKIQYHDHSIYRGYLSTVEDIIHFGVGEFQKIDTVIVQWPDGNVQVLQNVNSNKVLEVNYKDSTPGDMDKTATQKLLVEDITSDLKIPYKHSEDDKIDFNLQRTLPHKLSQYGPGLAVADINSDGLEDFAVGGSADNNTTFFVQNKNGGFSKVTGIPSASPKKEEDEGLLFFDADNDGDNDLYIVSGSNEYAPGSDRYQDRLYLNNGKGNFSLQADALPKETASGSCVRAADFDADGDLDLFVGGRSVPGSYPLAGTSIILKNEKGKFSDITIEISPELRNIGMVTDALWTDFNSDGKSDLIVAGEFMPVTFFENDGSKLKKLETTGVESHKGWWNSLTGADFDDDGDTDYIAGNLGVNNYYCATMDRPLKIFAKDFDGNGSVDPILACYFNEAQNDEAPKLFPVHFWDELSSQSPKFRQQFINYKQYGKIDMTGLLTEKDLDQALMLEANDMASSYIENLGGNKFKISALPELVQVGPVNGIVTADCNNDGYTDVLMVGNDYGNEVFAGRYDAFIGLVLLGDGKGHFAVVPESGSGFYVGGDAKAFTKLFNSRNEPLFIASQNRGPLKIFTETPATVLKVNPRDIWAELVDNNGRKTRVEFYYGSGFLSQSSRNIQIPKNVVEINVYDVTGKARKVSTSAL
jgi:hypothetical protein